MNRWVDEQIFPAALSLILTSCSPCSASTSLPSPEPSAPCWRAETGRTPQSPPRSRPPPGPESGSGRTAWTPSLPETKHKGNHWSTYGGCNKQLSDIRCVMWPHLLQQLVQRRRLQSSPPPPAAGADLQTARLVRGQDVTRDAGLDCWYGPARWEGQNPPTWNFFTFLSMLCEPVGPEPLTPDHWCQSSIWTIRIPSKH